MCSKKKVFENQRQFPCSIAKTGGVALKLSVQWSKRLKKRKHITIK